MNHCVGGYESDLKYHFGRLRIFSVRDILKNTRATLELKYQDKYKWEIVQYKSRFNRKPTDRLEKAAMLIVRYLNEKNILP